MQASRKRRDNALLDAIEAIEPLRNESSVWRVVREGRNPIQCSRSGGRWDDGTFDVLYTSETKQGAISEIKFHLTRGQPLIPSQVKYCIYEIGLGLQRALKLLDMAALAALGLDVSRYGQLSFNEKHTEYPRSQDIAEAAHFLDYDGLIVPSARHQCLNVIAFCDRLAERAIVVKKDDGAVEWG